MAFPCSFFSSPLLLTHLWNDLLLIAPLFVPDPSAPSSGEENSLKDLNAVPEIPAQEIRGESRGSSHPPVALLGQVSQGQGRGWQGPDPTPSWDPQGTEGKEGKEERKLWRFRNSSNVQFVPISLTFFPGSPLLAHPALSASSTLFLTSLGFPGDSPFLIPRPGVIVLPP